MLWVQSGLRGFSVGALWVATLAAGFLIVRHVLPLITGSQLPISLKSGVPLIAIGISYFILIITLPRTPGQHLVGILMGSAFVLLREFSRVRRALTSKESGSAPVRLTLLTHSL